MSDETLIGRYRVVKPLGAGGMGEVFLADDTLLERKVAIKLLRTETAGDSDARQRMLREARTAARLDHPNVCAIYEAGFDTDRIYLVMQYLEGQTAADLLRTSGLLPVHTALEIAKGVAAGLEEAHRLGIIHRDIKPHNVMVTPRGVRVLDFGLARDVVSGDGRDQITRTGLVTGTTAYMSPEQLRGGNVGAESDVFSFGVMLYELLASHRPFDRGTAADTISAILREEPPPLPPRGARATALEPLLREMLDKDPARRPPLSRIRATLDDVTKISVEEGPTAIFEAAPPAAAQPSAAPSSAKRSATVIADPELQKLYAIGLNLLAKRAVPAVKQALETFQKVIDADPQCAPAYSGLADCYVLLGFLQVLAPRSAFPKARAAASHAIDFAPDRADAHATLGYVSYLFDWNIAEAERKLRAAIEIDPGFALAHHWLGFVLAAVRRFPEARVAFVRATELDPLSSIFAAGVAILDVHEAQLDRGIRAYREILEVDPAFVPAHFYLGLALERAGRASDALEALQKAVSLTPVRMEAYGALLHLLGRTGRVDEARVRLEELRRESAERYVPPLYVALAHLGIGEYDEALAYLGESVEARSMRLSELHLDPRWAPVATDSRFIDVLVRIGIAPM